VKEPRPPTCARFGGFALDLKSLELRRAGQSVDLQLQPKKVLAHLVQNPLRIVSREELQQHLWGDRHVDAAQGLNNAVRQIRKALQDSAERPEFIETVPRQGYRFMAPVEIGPAEDPAVVLPPPGRTRRAWLGVLLVALVLVGAGFVARWTGRPRVAPDHPLRLAVLPLETLGDPEGEPLSALFSEEIITALASLDTGRLTVLSRASMQRYSHHPRQLQRVAEELGATYLVEGSVRADPQGTILLVRLIRGGNESVVWGKRFAFDQDRVGSGALVVATEIARALSEHALEVPLQAPRMTEGLANPEAWAAFVEARFRLSSGTAEDLETARQLFRRVTELAPRHAPAWLGLAQATWGLPCDDRRVREEARALSERALELDPLSGQAHVLRGTIAFLQEWDPQRAEEHFQRALELAGGQSKVHSAYGFFLAILGRSDAAIQEAERALELDPISGLGHYHAGATYLMSRQNHEAAAICRRAMDQMCPECAMLQWCLLDALMGLGEYEEARERVLGWLRQRPDREPVVRAVAAAPSARQAVQVFLVAMAAANGPEEFGSDFTGWKALKAARAGQKDQALDWLEEAHRERSCSFFWASSPVWDPWRGDPRFQALVADSPLAAASSPAARPRAEEP